MENDSRGRKNNQKMKPYLVYQYLLRNSDENHVVSSADIVGYLQELGIDAERRSIYKDIEEINKAIWILENDSDLDELQDYVVKGYYDDEKLIVYDNSKKGFYIRQRKYDSSDIRLISECIYSSKYISQKEAERLVDIMKDFISDYQAKDIRKDALVTNRFKTLNKNVLNNVSLIYDAMSKKLDGQRHIPEKITFQYMKSDINDLSKQIVRHKGMKYSVSPYRLIINDGNYYLLAFDDYSQEMRTYRVDRMKSVALSGQAREGEEVFKSIDVETYTQRTFSMFSGVKERVRIKFPLHLLDSVYERFGKDKTIYQKTDNHHFSVVTDVEISEQFFGWLCGFGKKAVIESPQEVVEQFKNYMINIIKQYE